MISRIEQTLLVNLSVPLFMSVLHKWPWLISEYPQASRVAGSWICGRGRSPSKSLDWSEGAHATLSSAPGAESFSVPWLSDSIRRLVIMLFSFSLFTTCVDHLLWFWEVCIIRTMCLKNMWIERKTRLIALVLD